MLRRIICSSILFFLFFFSIERSIAQSGENRFEAGGQFSVLQVETRSVGAFPFPVTKSRTSDFGLGGRFGYNISNHFAAEAEINVFPNNDDERAGRKLQGLFGVRAGKKFTKIGVFAKARPGFIRYEKGDYIHAPDRGCFAIFPNPLGCLNAVARASFAMDLGGVLEFYPSSRTIIRVDAGDTIVRLPARIVAAPFVDTQGGANYLAAVPVPRETKHQFQGSVGFGFRF
jgi:hypothetical protein